MAFKPEFSVQMTGATGALCAGSLAPLEDSRSIATVTCPLTGAVYNKSEYAGKLCPTCNMTKLGDDVLGLSI